MPKSVDNITSGPAKILLGATEIPHTENGVAIKISPKNRMRTVDKFGVGNVAVIHTGDDVRINTSLAEWSADTLAIVHNPGNNTTAATGSGSGVRYIGIGRSAGYIYTTTTMDVVPFLTADAGRGAFFEKVTPIGEFTLDHKADNDRIFACEWVALVKESNTDGELIGKIRLP